MESNAEVLSVISIEDIVKELKRRSNIRFLLIWEDTPDNTFDYDSGSTAEATGLVNQYLREEELEDLED